MKITKSIMPYSYVYRSSETGKFISEKVARETDPSLWVREKVYHWKWMERLFGSKGKKSKDVKKEDRYERL